MGSLVSPIVANLYMEHFEKEALQSAPTPRYWFRFVDDTFVIQQQSQKQLFLDHINNIDPAIRFTVEGNQENGLIPFLDTLVKPETGNSLSFTVYCKPTHTDQYLQCDSHHNLSANYSVIGTLTQRAKTVCTGPEHFQRVIQHLREALCKCKYPGWAIHRVQNKNINSNREDNSNNNNIQEGNPVQDTHSPSRSTKGRPPRENPALDTLSSLTPKEWGKALRRSFVNMIFRNISRAIGV